MQPSDFIHPIGELQPALFPNEELADLVDTWLAEAQGKTAALPAGCVDEATGAWVYYRAYAAVANRIAATPTREAYFNNVDRWQSADRVEYFRRKAEEYRQRFEGLASMAGDGPAVGVVLQQPPTTGAAGLRAAW